MKHQQKKSKLVILAGPNGAGKSTLYKTYIRDNFKFPFINADEIQKNELYDLDENASYEAAKIATQRREKYLKEGKSFVTETVFSHHSKLNLIKDAKEKRFEIYLFHVSVNNPEISIGRVEHRVIEGGHNVPEDKIRQRYDRNGPLIREAVLLSDVAKIFDNSYINTPPKLMISFKKGKIKFKDKNLCDWVYDIYGDDIEFKSESILDDDFRF